MDRDAVLAWVADYESAWRANDPAAVETLFAPDASYWRSPYKKPEVGYGEIRAIWCDDGEIFTVQAEPVAVEDRSAVVRLLIRYGEPVRQEYKELWVLTFASDGRVTHFEEWTYAPEGPDGGV